MKTESELQNKKARKKEKKQKLLDFEGGKMRASVQQIQFKHKAIWGRQYKKKTSKQM